MRLESYNTSDRSWAFLKKSNGKKIIRRSGSKGPSAFIIGVRDRIKELSNPKWVVSSKDGSLRVVHSITTKTIENKFGEGLYAQIWMERPEKGIGRCKFEIANAIPSLSKERSISIREKISDSIRAHMIKNSFPKDIETASKSTIIATRVSLSRPTIFPSDISKLDEKEINKIINFYEFLNYKLDEWNNEGMIHLIK
jgi:hypothetical protein